MKPDKFTFLEGEDIPAKSFQTIDPDNLQPQTAGYLTGGTGHSALSVFQALGSSANDGKFKINVDGTVYDNLALDLTITNTESTLINQLSGTSATAGGPSGQSFTLSQKTKIKSLSTYFNSTPSSASARIRVGKSMTSEIVGESTSVVLGSPTTFTFGDGVVLEAGTYTFEIEHATGYIYFTTSNPYSGGNAFIAGSWRDGFDIKFSVIAATIDNVSSLDEIAFNLQSSIREATSSLETVIYDTDHFKITSASTGRDSKILKLMSPTAGTDISGAGAIPYLDMADNATETIGTGEEYNLVRLDENGILKEKLIEAKPIKFGTTTINASSSTAITITTGFRPRIVRVFATDIYGYSDYSFGSYNEIDGNKCASRLGISDTIYLINVNTNVSAVIQNITDTGFDIKPSGGGDYSDINIYWEAEK